MNLRMMPFKLVGLISAILMTEHALAAATVLPGSALPEQVSKSLTEEQIRPTESVAAPITPPEQAAPGLGAQAQKIKFKLNGIILVGNTIYSEAQLRPLYASKLKQTITVAELFAIVQELTNYYRNNGFIISRALLPPQHVKGGVVKIQIIEGYLDKVEVGGDPKRAKRLVYAFGRKIAEARPLQIKRMEHYLLLANEIPGTEVKAVLAPSKTQTGAADVTLMTLNRPITGYLSYDNYGTRYIGPQQLTAHLDFNSFIRSGDSTQFTYTRTSRDPKQLTYLDVNYNMAIGENGKRWIIGNTRTHTRPGFVLTPAMIDGKNNNTYTTLQIPVIRARSQTMTIQASFNYLNSKVIALGLPLYTDHLRNLGLGVNYSFADRWRGVNSIFADIRQGLPIWGYSSDSNVLTATTSRPGGRGDYTKVDFQLTRLQAVRGALTLFGLLKGQYSFQPLLSAEQFAYGGSQLGRGYDVAEIIGDRGLAGSLELRYDLTIGKVIQSIQLYTYYDIGVIWNYITLGGTPTKQSGASTGIGARFAMTKYVSGNLMYTQVLTKPVAAEALIGQGRSPRVFFSIVAAFG